MIRSFEVLINAAHPELPLFEASAIIGSASTAIIKRVPPKIGNWTITRVYVECQYPDNTAVVADARVGGQGVWIANLPPTEYSGRVKSGFVVRADAITEPGETVSGYILGIADFAVYTKDLVIVPGTTGYTLRYFNTAPNPPKAGDVATVDGRLRFFDGIEWILFADTTLTVTENGLVLAGQSDKPLQPAGDYPTRTEVEQEIDRLAAYYITYTAAGAAFPTAAALFNAETYYSGGVARVPTRNDYAVVLADETHGGAEYRYIYAVADGETVGQWEAQYPIETNDYTALSNKPSINGVTLVGDKTAEELDLARYSDFIHLQFAAWYPDGSVTSEADFTTGIKYAYSTADNTATVLPFCATGTADNDNSGLSGRVVIPPYVDKDGVRYAVVAIDDGYPAATNTSLTAIVAPTTVKNVGEYAFGDCAELATVSLLGATYIDERAFAYSAQLVSASLPAVTSIASHAFADCTALASITLPAATNIGHSAFINCSNLVSVSLPAATSIGDCAWQDCTALASISLPSATSIGSYAFSGCTSLATVSLPDATSIGDYAFDSCTELAVVDFGDTPRTTVPTLGEESFGSVPTTCKIIVPDAQYAAWTAATGWSALVSEGYHFLRKSDWEYARNYEVDNKLADKQSIITASGILKGNGSGTIASAVAGTDYQVPLTIDSTPTYDSTNPVQSGGVYTALGTKQESITASGVLKGDGQGGVTAAVAGTDYQTPLTIDSTPSSGSTNPVESGGVYTALADKQATITASGLLKGDGTGSVSAAVAGTDYQTPITVDASPTQSSTNPVQSGGVYTALDGKVDKAVNPNTGDIAVLTSTGGIAVGGADVPTVLRYAIGVTITASGPLADRTVTCVVPTANNVEDIVLTFPAVANVGKGRDFMALVTNTVGNTGAITFSVPSGATIYGDGFSGAIASGETWLFAITEITVNTFYTRAIKMEVAS